MSVRLWRHKRDKLDERVADARNRAEQAASEAELSRERHRSTREAVVVPLRRRGEDNRFADLLRRSLQLGYRDENGTMA